MKKCVSEWICKLQDILRWWLGKAHKNINLYVFYTYAYKVENPMLIPIVQELIVNQTKEANY